VKVEHFSLFATFPPAFFSFTLQLFILGVRAYLFFHLINQENTQRQFSFTLLLTGGRKKIFTEKKMEVCES